MMEETVVKILKEINNHGYEAYLVGGYPRDRYMNIYSTDYDICTNADIDILKSFLNVEKVEFLSSIVKEDNKVFEITRYRKDLEYKNHIYPKKVVPANSLIEDLQRRDFIINTLCMDADGNYIDLLNARNDIDNKIIRTVGNADDKICEDILRSLRAVRFATVLNFTLDEDLKKAIKKHRDLIKLLSVNRINKEIDKILNSKNKHYGISLLEELDILDIIENKINMKIK